MVIYNKILLATIQLTLFFDQNLSTKVRLSCYDSDDAAIFEAYNYLSKRKESLEEDQEEEEDAGKENMKENNVAAPNPHI